MEASQKITFEYKTLIQDLLGEYHDKELAEWVNAGWEIDNEQVVYVNRDSVIDSGYVRIVRLVRRHLSKVEVKF